jgi:hypothetical protein
MLNAVKERVEGVVLVRDFFPVVNSPSWFLNFFHVIVALSSIDNHSRAVEAVLGVGRAPWINRFPEIVPA